MKRITIAIDGYAGCGKSTTAKQVAKELGYVYIDTGAMYRAVSLFFLRNGIDFSEENEALQLAVQKIHIDFVVKEDGSCLTRLNSEIVEDKIREPRISNIVSQVAVHKSVRDAMVAQQRRMGADKGVVMDGRDIGTVVFPNADLKVFMTASTEVRATRRLAELQAKGLQTTLEEVIHNLTERDRIDTTRKIAPLKQAADALVLDTTGTTIAEQVQWVVDRAHEIMNAIEV